MIENRREWMRTYTSFGLETPRESWISTEFQAQTLYHLLVNGISEILVNSHNSLKRC